MCDRHRRRLLKGTAALATAVLLPATSEAASLTATEQAFLAEARRMKDEAVARGDQPYGAVLVLEGRIVGWGPSRVILDANPDAHAERVALWEAQKRLDRTDLAGAVIYSTSQPCAACQDALARAGVSRMVHGSGMDAGPLRRW